MKSNLKRALYLLAVSLLPLQHIHALPVPAELAIAVAEGYVQIGAVQKRAPNLVGRVSRVTTWESAGRPLFHMVRYASGGFVAIAGDDALAPVVAFSPTGNLELEPGTPLFDLLARDMSAGVKASEDGAIHADDEEQSLEQWERMLAMSPATRVETPDDICVEPLLTAKWNQGGSVYNLNTPNNNVCGCVATATAQVMKYWRYPTNSITPFTRTCYTNGIEISLTAIGGVYDWDLMPDGPNTLRNTTQEQREMLSKISYDVGVAVSMQYSEVGSGAYMSDIEEALTGTFGYANTKFLYQPGGTNLSQQMSHAIFSNIAAKRPVMLGVGGNDGGHAIVADGYGYSDGTRYTHLNMGWGGQEDVWYNLPSISTAVFSFDALEDVVYAIDPTASNEEYITGRITNEDGLPISGATVSATNKTAVITTTTDEKGIFALHVPSPSRQTTYTLVAESEGYTTGVRSNVLVKKSKSCDWMSTYGTVGSLADQDIKLSGDGPVVEPDRPENDDFAHAIELTGLSGELVATNTLATTEFDEPAYSTSAPSLGQTLWYSYTATQDQPLAIYGWCEEDDFTAIEVFTGDAVDALTRVVGARDSASNGTGYTLVRFTATAGVTYHIRVDTLSQAGGIFLGWSGNDLTYLPDQETGCYDGFWLGDGTSHQAVFAYGSTIGLSFCMGDLWGLPVLQASSVHIEFSGETTHTLEVNLDPLDTDALAYVDCYPWQRLQNLPPGDYTIKATLNATGSVNEVDQTDNIIERTFSVRAPMVDGVPLSGLSDTFVAGATQDQINEIIEQYRTSYPSATAEVIQAKLRSAESFGLTFADLIGKGLETFEPSLKLEEPTIGMTSLKVQVANGVTSDSEAATRLFNSTYRRFRLCTGVLPLQLSLSILPTLSLNPDGTLTLHFPTSTTSDAQRFWQLKVEHP